MNGGGMGFGGMGSAGMGLTWLFGLLMLAGVILVVFVLVKAASGRSRTPGATTHAPDTAPGRAREILEERYARGEISSDEFRERLRTLQGDGG